jgi:putative pyoverdin transport system ATP-binding/permease protein
MKLISFLMRYSPGSVITAGLAGVVSGACNAALLVVFNDALRGEGGPRIVWAFAALCLFLPVTRYVSEMLLARLAQDALFNLRLTLSRQILSAPQRHLEELGAHRLMTALTDDVPVITNTLVVFPLLCINFAITLSGLIYLGFLSWVVLLAVLGMLVVGIATYQLPVIRALRSLRSAREDADNLFKHFRSLTQGTKELKLHQRRRQAFLTQSLQATADSMRKHNLDGLRLYTAAASWGQSLVFIVIGLIIFALPRVQSTEAATLTGYTITLLYLMTPLQVIMNALPNLSRADVALGRVDQLGLELAAKGAEGMDVQEPSPAGTFQRLDLVGVTHSYRREGEKDNFVLGPVDFTLRPGELVFIAGGNGSGKTTLAKLLVGLYIPEQGEARLNGQTVTDENRELYRQQFSVVFSDFHLFESLLGLEGPRLDEAARAYLAQLQLTHKIDIKDGVLSTLDLSQGQRKRLALLTAYLEDRPVYLFDEWAADQDPYFKEVFYYQLLPELKTRGKAVVVISHDDHYYHVADRVVKLEYGKIEYDRELSEPGGLAPALLEGPIPVNQ